MFDRSQWVRWHEVTLLWERWSWVLEILLAAPARGADRGLGDAIIERCRGNTVATGSQIVISVV